MLIFAGLRVILNTMSSLQTAPHVAHSSHLDQNYDEAGAYINGDILSTYIGKTVELLKIFTAFL